MAKPIKIHDEFKKPSGANIFIVNSSTDARRRYTVQKSGKTWACSCKGWIFRFPRKNCRHIREVLSQIAA